MHTFTLTYLHTHTHTLTYLHTHIQGYELISSLQSEDQQVRYIHYEEFSRVIVEVVGHYIEKVCQHIPAYETDLGKMCMLLNNLHALRINIQDLFNVMGGEEVSSCCLANE